MEAKLKKSGFQCYQKTYTRTLRKEEAQDCVVPDTMPDITSLAATWGNVLIRSKDVGDGRVRVEANVPVKVSFLPEGEGALCCLDVNIPFYFSAEDAAIHEGAQCSVDMKLLNLETRMLNPRKITVRAEVELTLECYEAGETLFSTVDESSGCIHVRERQLEITAAGCVTEKTFVLTDELTLPPELPPVSELLGQSAQLHVTELKAVGSKLVIRGCARSTLLYQTPEGETAAAAFSTEFSQIVDTEIETEDAHTAVKMLLSGLYYDILPGYNGRTLQMELHAVAQLTVYKEHTVSCMTDAYSNLYALELARESVEARRIIRGDILRSSLRERLSLPRPAAEILCCTAECVGIEQKGAEAMLTLQVLLCCRTADGGVFSTSQLVTAAVQPEPKNGETAWFHSADLSELSTALTDAGVELRCTAELSVFLEDAEEVACIHGISYDENALLDLSDRPSLVIMRVSSADDLWQLARENCSTQEAIRELNGLEAETGAWEKLLLIPRTN